MANTILKNAVCPWVKFTTLRPQWEKGDDRRDLMKDWDWAERTRQNIKYDIRQKTPQE